MTWTYEELDLRFRTYSGAASVRENSLLKVFFGILGAVVVIIVLLFTSILPKPYADVGLVVALVAFGLLATYVMVTARAFHKIHGVFCPHCEASLVSFGNILDGLEEDGLEKPESLECPQCHSVLVKKNT
jgi:general stress protein CsbA